MSQSTGLYQAYDKPSLVAYNDTLYLMWKGAGSPGIFTSQSTDFGLTWSPEIRTNLAITSPNAPSFIITPDGTIHLAYRGTDSIGNLWYSSSTDFVSWTNPVTISNFNTSDTPSLANYGNTIYLLWKGSTTDTGLHYSKRDPTTNQWGTPVALPTTTYTASSGPAFVIAQDGSQHFLYRGTDNGLRYVYRANETANWSSPSNTIGSSSEKPTLAFDSAGLLHAVWKGTPGNTVWHSVGTFDGTKYVFSGQVQINTVIQTDFGLGLTFLSGMYHLAYKGTAIDSPLLLASSVDGSDWKTIPHLAGYSSDRPTLAFSFDSFLLMGKGPQLATFVWRSVRRGRFWTSQEPINLLIQTQSGPSLFVSDSGLHYLVYQGLNNEVLYSTSRDGETWNDPSDSLGSTGDRPAIAASGKNVFIMFKGVGTDNSIYLTTNFNGPWSNPISTGLNALSGPTLLYNGGQTFHIAFRGTDNAVYYAISVNSGQSWVTTKLDGSTSDSPVLQLYNGKILIFWKGPTGDDQFYYSVSTTQLKDWTPAIQLSPAFKSAFAPAILIYYGTALMVIRGSGYYDGLYYASGSLDLYWRTPSKISGGFSSDSPSVAPYNGNVRIVWKGVSGDNQEYYSESTTGGNTWGGTTQITNASIRTIWTPSLLDWANGQGNFNLIFTSVNNTLIWAYDQNYNVVIINGANSSDGPTSVVYKEKMYLFWKGITNDNAIYSIVRSSGPVSQNLWSPVQQLPGTINTLNRPTAVISGSVLNLFYRGTDQYVFISRNSDGGNWPIVTRLQGVTSRAPGATNYDGRLCVVWTFTDNNIYFSRSDEDGNNWSQQTLIPSTVTLNGPSIAAVNGRLHLVFLGSPDSSVTYCMGQDIVNWNLVTSVRAMADANLATQVEDQISQLDNNKLNEIVVPVKICFNQEIHKLSTIPTTYQNLIKTISSMFGDRLPRKWVLSYIDSQGDNIALSDENDLKALIEDAEKALKTVKILIFPIDSFTESVDYHVIDSDAQGQSMGQTPFGISQTQVKEAPESRSELVVHAKKIVKKLTKSDLTQDKREQLETEFNRVYRDLTQDEIILIEKHRAKCMEEQAEKEAQRKNELKALLTSLINEQGLVKVAQNSSPQVANQEETKTSAIHVPQMKKKYPAQVQEKAQMMKNIFAGSSIEDLLDFVSKSPNVPLEQLVRNYVSH